MKSTDPYTFAATWLAAAWIVLVWCVLLSAAELLAVRVVDGDTLVLTDGRTVRLHGVDAPELDQPHGDAARIGLQRLVADRELLVVAKGQSWGRTVAHVTAIAPGTGKRIDVAATLVVRGHAWHDARYKGDERLPDLQVRAREQRLGLWRGASLIPPWEWRKGVRGYKRTCNGGVCTWEAVYE